MSININLDLGAQAPERSTEGSVGYDLRTSHSFTIGSHEMAEVDTGVHIEFPEGIYGRIEPRSGLARRCRVTTNAGIIDTDYRGSIIVILENLGHEKLHFEKGDRIAQLVFAEATLPDLLVSEDVIAETTRGDRGFGSSGLKGAAA